MAATLDKNMIVVFGGECRDGKTFSENEGYDLATGQWKALQPAEGRHGVRRGHRRRPRLLRGRRTRVRQ